MLSLDEAIRHCEEKAEEILKANEEMPTDCKLSEDLCECANEHLQLAKWLTELKAYRECQYIQDECADCDYCPNSKNTWQEGNDK